MQRVAEIILYYHGFYSMQRFQVAMSQYTDSEAAQIGITIMFTIIVITNLLGNTAVCLVIILNRDMRYDTSFQIKLNGCYGAIDLL